jgi:GNAT superfamily N-acetyltransferase
MNFDAFLSNQNIRNQWIAERDISVYIRRSVRVLDATMPKLCLDIGSVEVEEEHRGMGIFTSFLNRFEKAAKDLNRSVYIESILNPRLIKFLERRGYKLVPGSQGLAPNMFKHP